MIAIMVGESTSSSAINILNGGFRHPFPEGRGSAQISLY